MKVFSDKNVLESATERINYLFDEFEDIYVMVSGGKDSTVVFNLTLDIARQRNRRIGMFFLDQEFEYQGTIDMIRYWASNPDVDVFWMQAPMRMSNSSSELEPWVKIWSDERKGHWMRDFEPGAFHHLLCKSDRFAENLNSFLDWRQKETGRRTAGIGGLRAEESFNRFRAISSGICYKNITWGRRNAQTVCFYPIYDWTFRDVWKYINDNNLRYNHIYDCQFRAGYNPSDMRVSNMIHEFTTMHTEHFQEFEPKTYERLVDAIEGIATTARFAEDFIPKKLPDAFGSWKEYRDYLVDTIVAPEYREGFKKLWADQNGSEEVYRIHCIECIKADVSHSVNEARTKIVVDNMKRAEKNKRKASRLTE